MYRSMRNRCIAHLILRAKDGVYGVWYNAPPFGETVKKLQMID